MPHARHISHDTTFYPLPSTPTKNFQNEWNDSLKVWGNNVSSKLLPSTKTSNTQHDDNNENNHDNFSREEEAMNLVESFMEAMTDC